MGSGSVHSRNEEEPLEIDFQNPFYISLVAPPKSGKTFSLNFIARNAKKAGWNSIFVISGSAQPKNYPFAHPSCVHSYNDEIMTTILKIINTEKERKGKRKFLLCFDDIGMFARKLKASKLEGLCTLYRHYNVSLIFCAQYATQLTTTMRECTQITIAFAQNNHNSLKLLFEMMGASMDVEKQKDFNRILREITQEEFTALLVDNQQKGYSAFKAE